MKGQIIVQCPLLDKHQTSTHLAVDDLINTCIDFERLQKIKGQLLVLWI